MSKKLGQKKAREQAMKVLDDGNDSWAEVELYRWQHGTLPTDPGKPLDPSIGLKNMAEAIMGQRADMPSRFSVASVLIYAADKLKKISPK